MTAIATTCLWCALQVSIFVAVVSLLYLVLRRWSLEAGGLIAAVSLAVVVLISGLAFSPWPRWELATAGANLPKPQTSLPITETEQATAPETVAAAPTLTPHPPETPQAGIAAWLTGFGDALTHELTVPAADPTTHAWTWTEIAVAACLALSAFGCVRLLAGLWAVRTLRKAGRPIEDDALRESADLLRAELACPRRVELLEADQLAAPATVGWRRPVILLPAAWRTWTPLERRAVLAHEIAHIRRGDFLTYVIAQIGLVLHYYNPLVHWLAGRLRLEQELAADASAAALAGGRLEYLQMLAAMALRQADQPTSWPARTFLPSRGHLIRRVEMLKHSKRLSTRLPGAARVVVVGLLAAVGIGIVGLRQPDAPIAIADEPQFAQANDEKPAAAKALSDRFELSYIPANAIAVAGVRPAAIFRNEELAAMAEMLNEDLGIPQIIGMPVEEIEQISVAVTHSEKQPVGSYLRPTFGTVMIRAVRPTDFRYLTDYFAPDAEEKHHGGKTYFKSPKLGSCYMRLGDRTILLDDEDSLINAIENGPAIQSKLLGGAAWDAATESHIFCALDPDLFSGELATTPQPAIVSAFAPIWKDSQSLMICGTVDQDVTVQGFASCDSEEKALNIQATLQGAAPILTNVLSERHPADHPFAAFSAEALAYLKGSNVTRKGKTVHVASTSPIPISLLMGTVMAPGMSAQQFLWRRNKAIRSARQIALAMHKYNAANGHFPPAVVIGPDGKTPHSWRVALLPYLGLRVAGDLYRGYKLDEPWDSEHNKHLLRKMPAVYGHDDGAGITQFAVFAGPGTPFGNPNGITMNEVWDGVANTLMFVESNQTIPWTKPEDIPYDPAVPLPKLGGPQPDVIVVAKVDGSIALMPSEGIADDLWRSVITYNGTRRDPQEYERSIEFFKKKLPLSKPAKRPTAQN
ncbi:Regulatory protein BlaR1 [Symmachiella dynata]|uniref:M56 family metallopeptidase n=1 Tax=Symmachiella dynata TaxID=2527995 RepID=UPI001187A482|nr:M56 family metallopeptidase [Symmachiella dynata]QDT46372.1 Regulatory protein BlaR1 [Symmachiella dynata]